MKITFITPPSSFLLDERVFASLGILRVAAMAEKAGHDVAHIDLSGVTNYLDVIREYREDAVFAMTATTPQMPAAIAVVNALRERGLVKIILGGPHSTLIHAAARKGNKRATEALKDLLSRFDCVVAGDGEKSIFRAIHEYGLIDADDPGNALWMKKEEYNESPWPARHLIDMDSYHYTIDERRSLSLIGQLGCTYGCFFCGGRNSPMLRRARTRSPENIVQEMLFLNERYGIDGLFFLDDEINLNRKITMELLRQIAATKVDWRLRAFVKAELFNEEQAAAMYAAGFRWLLCGFESGHPRILKNIHKNATVEDNTRVIQIAHKYGLKVKALMSYGHPAESEETILATRDWLLAEKPDDFDITCITVYPGTSYNDDAEDISSDVCKFTTNGDVLYFQNLDFTKEIAHYKGKIGEYNAFIWTDYISREKIASMRDEAEHEVRIKLGIPYPTGAAAITMEHSTGMGLTPNILRKGIVQ